MKGLKTRKDSDALAYQRKLILLVAMASPALSAEKIPVTESIFTTSYKCRTEIVSGLGKKNGEVFASEFNSRGTEFFITHSSDFSGRVLDAYLDWWNASEEQKAQSYKQKSQLVSEILFDADSTYVYKWGVDGDLGFRNETGFYHYRTAAEDPKLVLNWKSCTATSANNSMTTLQSITCNVSKTEIFQMHASTLAFTHAYLGSLHHEKTEQGYEGDSAIMRHGTCQPYYP